jgi:hypothetical protein
VGQGRCGDPGFGHKVAAGQRSQRLELEIEPDPCERIEELSIRSGRSIPEIIQGLISCSFPMKSTAPAGEVSPPVWLGKD